MDYSKNKLFMLQIAFHSEENGTLSHCAGSDLLKKCTTSASDVS